MVISVEAAITGNYVRSPNLTRKVPRAIADMSPFLPLISLGLFF